MLTPPPATSDEPRFEVHATAESHFSWLRTRMSTERTLMSAARTAVALIGFGFTIVQFFERLAEYSNVAPGVYPSAPRYLGVAMISAGILSLVVALVHHRALVRYLGRQEFSHIRGFHDAPVGTGAVAIVIVPLLVGLFAFGAVFSRLA